MTTFRKLPTIKPMSETKPMNKTGASFSIEINVINDILEKNSIESELIDDHTHFKDR